MADEKEVLVALPLNLVNEIIAYLETQPHRHVDRFLNGPSAIKNSVRPVEVRPQGSTGPAPVKE